MTREETAERIKVMQSYVDGKQIQYMEGDSDVWHNIEESDWYPNLEYRVKPAPNFRSFKDAEECWQEMLNHQPFGWVLFLGSIKNLRFRACISAVYNTTVEISDRPQYDFKDAFEGFTFADGTPFGIKEE